MFSIPGLASSAIDEGTITLEGNRFLFCFIISKLQETEGFLSNLFVDDSFKKREMLFIPFGSSGVIKRVKKYFFIVNFVVIFFLIGCTDKEILFEDLYDGDSKRVEKIVITDGATGERRVISSSRQINNVFSDLENITFKKSDMDKDEINGFLYAAGFYEKGSNEPFFTMSTNLVNDHVYEVNERLADLFEKYFNEGKVDG